MNIYKIERKVYTYSEIWESQNFELKGYSFKNWEFSHKKGCYGNAWLVSKEIKEKSIHKALKKFNKELHPILIRASYVSQCGMQHDVNPLLIEKISKNPEKIFYLYYVNEVKESSLYFARDEQESLAEIIKLRNNATFEFLSASNNSYTYHARLVSLIMALESMASEKEVERKCANCGKKDSYKATDKNYIKNVILKDQDLFKKIYDYKTGFRNSIFHGKYLKPEDGIDYAQIIYNKIREFFTEKYKIKINNVVVGAPRNGLGKYEQAFLWAKPKDPSKKLNFKQLLIKYKKAINSTKGSTEFRKYYKKINNVEIIKSY